jgi:hypothetical protein
MKCNLLFECGPQPIEQSSDYKMYTRLNELILKIIQITASSKQLSTLEKHTSFLANEIWLRRVTRLSNKNIKCVFIYQYLTFTKHV